MGIEAGRAKIERLDNVGERGRIRGGLRNIEATLLLVGQERTRDVGRQLSETEKLLSEARDQRAGRSSESARQEAVLEKWARNEGIWIDEKEFAKANPVFNDTGSEAVVYRPSKDYVLKFVDYRAHDEYKATPLDFIDKRISAYNGEFDRAPLTLEGVTRDKNGVFRFVVKQPFIKGTEPTLSDIQSSLVS